MKKRLLITSIVMMLVCAVALSTATYAWFTSNATVTASSITMTAATSDASALGIGWIGASNYLPASTSISADSSSGNFRPAVPNEIQAGVTTYGAVDSGSGEDAHNIAFKGATIKTVSGQQVFNNDVYSLDPYIFSNTDNNITNSAFYVKNLSTSNSITNLKLTLNWGTSEIWKYTAVTGTYDSSVSYFTKDGNNYVAAEISEFADGVTYYTRQDIRNDNLIRVAVFARDAAKPSVLQTSAYELKGILGKTAGLKTEYGDVQNGGNVAALCTDGNEIDTVTYIDFGTLGAEYQVDMVVMVWLDGVVLDDNNAGKASDFGLNFEAAPAGAPQQGGN